MKPQTIYCQLLTVWIHFNYISFVYAETGSSLITKVVKETQNQKVDDIAVLKSQLLLMKEFNQNILSTVYWSLGTIVVLAVLLVGFSWFTNYKMYERELTALKHDLLGFINKNISEFRKDFEDSSKEQFKDISTSCIGMLDSTIKDAIDPINDKIDILSHRYYMLDYKCIMSEARYWEIRGVKGNEIDKYINMLELSIKMQYEQGILSSLENITRLLSDGTSIYHSNIATIMKLVEKLDYKYSVHTEALLGALKCAKSY